MRRLFVCLLVAAGCGSAGPSASTNLSACTTLTACVVNGGGISPCTAVITQVDGFLPDQINCLARAGSDCARARACLNGGSQPPACTGNGQTCDGTVLQTCSQGAGPNGENGITRFDCGSIGQSCVINGGHAGCGYGACAGASVTCMGSVVQSCDGNILHRQDCAEDSATCIPDGIPHCRGTGPACDINKPTSARCEGSVAVTCVDGQEARFDCAHRQMGCYSDAKCAYGDECDPTRFDATCNGLKLAVCNLGRKATVDCGAAGFTGCDPRFGGRCTK